eukprot:TRINITY_DN1924_c0_g1_i1.p1 TRINITY_DN1924_c0_g1~~TRINITY_DN1924_c0_g1_i1.p1  ORF type:complete len:264 (+),score=47.80 TRINITY_DN1924_c0_g1_i1:72-863(+)
MEESVYNLIPKPVEAVVKPPRYHSKYPGESFPTASTFALKSTSRPGVANLSGDSSHPDSGKVAHTIKKPAATLGTSRRDEIAPDAYLKKSSRALAESSSSFSYGDPIKPAVPKKEEAPVMGLKTSKNFVVSNAVDNILAVPKKLRDDDPNYLKRPGFGEVPKYLVKNKREIEEEQRMIRDMQERQTRRDEEKTRLLTEDERHELISGLRAQYDKLNHSYQTLSFTLDTPAKRERKEALEREMSAIEKDIERLNKKYIFVADYE